MSELMPCPFCGLSVYPVNCYGGKRRRNDPQMELITHINVDCPLDGFEFTPKQWSSRHLSQSALTRERIEKISEWVCDSRSIYDDEWGSGEAIQCCIEAITTALQEAALTPKPRGDGYGAD